MLSAYARFIVRRSYLVLFVVITICTVLTVIPLVCHNLPSFSDPLVGFETRGTTLAGRFIAWENLIDETRPSRSLAANPQEIADQARMNRTYTAGHRDDIPKSRSGFERPEKKVRNKNKKNITITEVAKNSPDGHTKKKKNSTITGIATLWPDEHNKKKKNSTITGISELWPDEHNKKSENNMSTETSELWPDEHNKKKKNSSIAEISKLWPEEHNKKKKNTSIAGISKLWPDEHNKKKKYTSIAEISKLFPDRQNKNKKISNIAEIAKLWPNGRMTVPPDPDITNINYNGPFGINKPFEDEETILMRNQSQNKWKLLKELAETPLKLPKTPLKPPKPKDNYASISCGPPAIDFAHLVVTTRDNTSLLTFENVKNLCGMQAWLIQIGGVDYFYMCQRSTQSEEYCCPIWSVPNYIALISGKDSCEDLTRDDVDKTVSILRNCAKSFHNLGAMSSCEGKKHCILSDICAKYDAVYNMLFYLIDAKAFAPNSFSNDFVDNVMMFLPLPASSTVLPYYNKLQSSNMTYDNLFIPAMDFGLKNTIFDLLVIQDTWLIALGGLFVFLSVWIYTKSLLLTLLLFTAITYSLGIAYFLYVYVYHLDFFPFMNLLVIVVVIGIGADDAFLYVKVWNMVCKQLIKDNVANPDNEIVSTFRSVANAGEALQVQILQETLKHSVVAIFVTSLTTAVAFFASYVSYIPAINCFSVFAGTAVLVNFFLMVSLMPVSVFLVDVKIPKSKMNVLGLLNKAVYDVLENIRGALNTFIVWCVIKWDFVVISPFWSIALVSVLAIIFFPGQRLPDSREFQLFHSSHPFEQYDMKYRDNFLFERSSKDFGVGGKMPLRWIWGVQAIDNGNHMDPGSKGHLVLDEKFTISEPSSQEWLLGFCHRIKAQPFYEPTLGPLLPNCFIEIFKKFMDRPCMDFFERTNKTPCCSISRFPYKKEVFDFCIIKAMESLYATPRNLFLPGAAGPKFLRRATRPTVAVVVVEFESRVPYSMSYSAMNKFFLEVENWTQHEMNSAPPGMSRGWFLSDLQFYDLQNTLASGTVMALLLSAALGSAVLIPATMSFAVSLCALIAITSSSIVTIALLVISNWKLNVLESVAISTSAGLAVDFSLHYALSYTNAIGDKSARVKYALSASSGPTFAAAITTGFSGIFLIHSNLLPYSQIGTFLALIMSVSWVYATFCLCPMLHVFGGPRDPPAEGRKPMSRVSSICSGVPQESHELERLAGSNRTTATFSHSPSTVSAATVMIHEDYDYHAHNYTRPDTVPSLSNYVNRNYD